MKIVVSIIITIALVVDGFSQTCCTGGAPITGSFRINHQSDGAFGINLTYDYNKIEDFFQNDKKLNDNYIKRSSKTLFLQLNYGITENIAVSVLVPYIWLNEKVLSSNTIRQTSGIGDMVLTGLYTKPFSELASGFVGLGLKIPMGNTRNRDQDGQFVLPANLQPGTGSFDMIFLARYQSALAFRRSLVVTGSIFYKVNTSSDKFTFHNSYKFGNELQAFMGVYDQLAIKSILSSPSLQFRFRHTDEDELEGFSNDNTGGNWLYISPGWTFTIYKNIELGVNAEFPVYRKLNGFQITTTNKLIFFVILNISKNNTLDEQIKRNF